MPHIPPPKPGSPDQFLECQEAIEGSVQDIIADAYTAGWSHAQVIAAIIEVAENLALGLGENAALDELLGNTRRKEP
ncbi:hypothetical protein ACRQ1B_28775 [Rhizobium panacihumi]|uniref:hypothetical protein n=1 Tax=Rhizobium panacihumi TaxID=2008450 RepID=UPI003D7A1D87